MNNAVKEKRNASYDLLRCIATFGVIILHVSATYKLAITNRNVFGTLYKEKIAWVLAFNTFFRFAVPSFLLLSGALILCREENKKYKYFYKKSFEKLGIHIVFFSILYTLYSLIKSIVKIMVGGGKKEILVIPFINLMKGTPFYHMWYVYMLIGIYALIPIVFYFRDSIEFKSFVKITGGFVIISCLSIWTTTYDTNWNIGISFCFLSYVMMGYIIKKLIKEKNNKRTIVFVSCGILIEAVIWRIQYLHSMRGIAEANENYSIVGPGNPFVLIASCLIFIGFTYLEIRENRLIYVISRYSFYIYLFHAGVWDILEQIVKIYFRTADSRAVILLGSLATFLVSLALAVLYDRLWKCVGRENV